MSDSDTFMAYEAHRYSMSKACLYLSIQFFGKAAVFCIDLLLVVL